MPKVLKMRATFDKVNARTLMARVLATAVSTAGGLITVDQILRQKTTEFSDCLTNRSLESD